LTIWQLISFGFGRRAIVTGTELAPACFAGGENSGTNFDESKD
jgi:hypothetical protein